MKSLGRMLALAAFGVLSCAVATAVAEDEEQAIRCGKVPAVVREAFAKAYPRATIKGCAREVEEGRTAYEIASVEGKTARDVLYYADGRLIVVEETIAARNVPKPVQQAVHRKKGEIILAEKLMRGSSVTYEFQIRHRGKTVEVVFDAGGNELKP